MQPGNLVKIKRASIGMPQDTLALLMSCDIVTLGSDYSPVFGDTPRTSTKIWHVSIVGPTRRLTGRYLEGDLELIS